MNAQAGFGRRMEIVGLLADGEVHSGEALAAALSVSRAAVWKQVRALEDWGLAVQAAPGRGYRLDSPVELLDAARIRSRLMGPAAGRLRTLEVLTETGSTNTHLLQVPPVPAGRFDACLAEFQSAGRGRRGRSWVAPFGSGLCLSLGWTFALIPSQLPALSLAVGVGILRSLDEAGVRGASLKWPNDVLLDGGKLGGVLIELRAEAGGPAQVVIGIGLNVRLPQRVRAEIGAMGLAVADLAGDAGIAASRNALAAALINRLVPLLEEFEAQGFEPFAGEWTQADALRGLPARVQAGDTTIEGVARGIDADGALLLEAGGQLKRFISGEASLRPVA
ncbi:MAG: biotin--[acetyl-CoA-carboxylase] ligase [Gammaproteobacteria bacterium]|nr:biotin--[acetyl-CoA-carboxylase] ligase [Gammaproteobacteria bacterium]